MDRPRYNARASRRGERNHIVSNEYDEAPVIQGMAQTTNAVAAENDDILDEPRTPRVIGVRRVPMSIGELVAALLYRSTNPALAQVFVLTAMENFSESCASIDVVEFDASPMGAVVCGADWKAIAAELHAEIVKYQDYVNQGGLGISRHALEKEVSNMEQHASGAVAAYIDTVRAWDWTQPLDAEMEKLKAEIDPTGEITARFKSGQPH